MAPGCDDSLQLSDDRLKTPDDDLQRMAERYHLDDVERRALTLISRGYTNREIAADLSVEPQTVKQMVTSILRKLAPRDVIRLQPGARSYP